MSDLMKKTTDVKMNLSKEQLTDLKSFVSQHQKEDDEDSLAAKIAQKCSISEKVFPPNPSDTEGEIMDYQSSGESDGQCDPSAQWDHTLLFGETSLDRPRSRGSVSIAGPDRGGGSRGITPVLIPETPSQVQMTLADAISLFNSVLACQDEGNFYLQAGELKYLSKKKPQNPTRSNQSGPDSQSPGAELPQKAPAVSRGCQTDLCCTTSSEIPPTPRPRNTNPFAGHLEGASVNPELADGKELLDEPRETQAPAIIAKPWNPFTIFKFPDPVPSAPEVETQNQKFAGPVYNLAEMRKKASIGIKIRGVPCVLTSHHFNWEQMMGHQGKFPLKFWLRFATF
ncbi:putative phosphoprotein [Dillard's Draw virus]|uniref:Putative phosphoprotein n=1 Tax=Dillard's Draw virus TaxID=2315722 RepID=A0A385KKT5_9RHAB|nr:putative phosphoprotein [Dillard's Draw virus]AXZ78336.1 putative phosphoprotein [Dillard's Draw virus]